MAKGGVKRSREEEPSTISSKSHTTELKVTSFTEEPVAVVGSFFQGLQVPHTTEFDLYHHKKRSDKYVIHGENDHLNYDGETNPEETNDYVLALYDPIKKSLDLYKSPFIQGKVQAKSKRIYKGPSVRQAGVRNITQRNALGEAFGTKKAKAAITNLERNRIDSEKLQDIELDIIDTVKVSTQDLPTRAKMEEMVTHDRPTPVANVDATNVEDIYGLYDIIPKKEWSFLRVSSLFNESDESKTIELLPYSNSNYINKHLTNILAQKNTEKLQLLFYASLLFGVYENRRIKDKQSLMLKLQNKPSEILIDGILERFTIARSSAVGKSKDRSYLIDPHHEDKLLCYLLAIIFHIDNFMVEIPPLANELNMKPTRLLGLFKALGAIIKSATVGQAEAFGIAKSAASTYKIASLKVPFKLPEMSRRMGGKR
ncbi:RNA polymerase I associated factor, A49-like protein [Scheffersomyces coipomensis]|uniref:RNA polymerase I associated factor, A49-like protein n=1 Tax=Scheffersomyces coipomensis TaxID=1788519 RepID=UPI00315DC580